MGGDVNWGCGSVDGDVTQLVERLTGTLLTKVQFPCAARHFSPGQLSVQTLSVSRTLTCAVACINICATVKDHIVHVRVR